MTLRTSIVMLLAATACASAPVPRELRASQAPLPRSSIVAVLAHRSDLSLTDAQVTALERADDELQVQFARLRAEGGVPAPPAGGLRGSVHGGAPPSGQGGGQAVPGFGMNAGPGGFQLTPGGGGSQGGAPRGGTTPDMGGSPPADGAKPQARRPDPVKAQEALEASLDDADTRAFLKAEAVLTPAQRERAREAAGAYREQLFERRELERGR